MDNLRPEFSTTAPAPGTAATEFLVPTNAKLQRQVGSAAIWLWLFAAAAVVNSVLVYVKAPIGSAFSLFVCDFVFVVGNQLGPVFFALALALDAALVSFFVFLGFQVKRWRSWAFIMGMAVLTVDAVLIYFFTTLAGLWPFLIHGLAIYYIFAGSKAAKILNQRRIKGQA